MFSSQWRDWMKKRKSASIFSRSLADCRRPTTRLMLEELEQRTLLSTLTVLNNQDSGSGSLRDTIVSASSGDTIVFDSSLAGQTITLTSGELLINKSLDIEGLGANLLTVSGNNLYQVFNIAGGATDTISGLTITGGKAQDGGGVNNSGNLMLTNDTFARNRASYGGAVSNGAVFAPGATLMVSNSTFSENTAGVAGGGGGINSSFGSLTVINSTFFGNSAGSIHWQFNLMSISNSTIFGNSGAGIWGGGGGGSVSIYDSIVAGNSGADVNGPFTDLGGNLIGGNPMLGPLQYNGGPTQTMALLPGSPAIGAGNPANAPPTDQRGFPRVVNGKIDIGAYQAQLIPTTVGVFSSADPSVWGQPVSLTVVVNTGIAFPVPTGTVALFDETTNTLLGFTSPTATLTTAGLSVGTHVIQVTYSGDSNFAPSSATLTEIVNQAASVTVVSSLSQLSVFGQLLTISAHISAAFPGAGLPTGAVTFMDGTTTLGTAGVDATGTAVLSGISTLSIGSHTITATYSGDGNFTASSATMTQTVNAVTPANLLQVLSLTNPITILVNTNADAHIVLTAVNALPPGISGSVILNLGPGTYTDFLVGPPTGLSLSIRPRRLHDLASVLGFSPALTVTSGNVDASGLNLATATDAPTVLVTGGSLALRDDTIQESTGFTDAAITLTGGTLDLGTAADPGGNIITINGTGEFVHNTTPNLVPDVGDTFEVNGVPLSASSLSFTAVSSSASTAILNQPVTFTATVQPDGSGTPTGSVDFLDTTTTTDLGSAPVIGGTATLTTSALSVGSHAILATYSGDSNFTLSIDSLSQNVDYNFSGFLAPLNSNLTFGLGRTIPIQFQLTDFNGNPIGSLSAVTSLQMQLVDSSGNPLGTPFTPTAAGNTSLRFDPTSNQFIFNWQTKGLTAGYYEIQLALNDGTVKTKVVNLNTANAAASGAGIYLLGPVSSGLPSASLTRFPQPASFFATSQAALNAVLADWTATSDFAGQVAQILDEGPSKGPFNLVASPTINEQDEFWSNIGGATALDKIITLSGDLAQP